MANGKAVVALAKETFDLNMWINDAPEGALSMAMTSVCPLFNTNELTKNCVRLNVHSRCGQLAILSSQ